MKVKKQMDSNNQDKIKILILDDEKQFTEELSSFFENEYIAYEANNVGDGRRILNNQDIDILVLDVRLPGINGLEILQEVKENKPHIEVIVISAHGDMETVIKAMRLGAFDYLRKPFRFLELQISIERTQRFLKLQRQLRQIEEKNSLISKTLEDKIERQFIGVSPQIKLVLDQAKKAAAYPDANVLITGESGTGKENIARIIHYASQRKDNLFCGVNSSAITESLLESEFFGHKKGSFTGAINDKMGYFEACNNGTLFLDEIADMPFNLQAKILRATEEKVVTRVGDTIPIKTNFRIISATNHDIDKQVEEKKFRLDLLHRLNTLHIHIPPLREHKEDIKPLLDYYVNHFSIQFNKPNIKISEDVYEYLSNYDFPGNVRELKNMAERAVILCSNDVLTTNDFPLKSTAKPEQIHIVSKVELKTNEIKSILEALRACNYNQTAAAGLLGISRDSLIRKMRKHNISVYKGKEV